jgi:hypothetical protein
MSRAPGTPRQVIIAAFVYVYKKLVESERGAEARKHHHLSGDLRDLRAWGGEPSFILKRRIDAGTCKMAIATVLSSGEREEQGEAPKDEGRKRARGSEQECGDPESKGAKGGSYRPAPRTDIA